MRKISSGSDKRRYLTVLDNIDFNDISAFKQNFPKLRNVNKLTELSYGAPTTVLCRAATAGRYEMVAEMLKTPIVNIHQTDGKGATPLQLAVDFKHFTTAEILIKHGANPIFDDKRTALHLAAEEGNTGIIAAAISKGISPDITDRDGNTPLHIAVALGKVYVIQLLRGNGAMTAVKNNKGLTPIDVLPTSDERIRPDKIAIMTNLLDVRQRRRRSLLASVSEQDEQRHDKDAEDPEDPENPSSGLNDKLAKLKAKVEKLETRVNEYRNEATKLFIEIEARKRETAKMSKHHREIMHKLKKKEREIQKLRREILDLEKQGSKRVRFYFKDLSKRVRFLIPCLNF